jgi:hypothetical protein
VPQVTDFEAVSEKMATDYQFTIRSKSLQWKEIVAVGLRPSMLAALRCNPQVRRITHNEIVSVY